MNETHITVVGNVVGDPRRARLATGSVTNFRLASTARRFDGEAQDFVDSSTLWIDVACWGDLGGNVAHSVSKGDPVIVQGTIATDSWETDAGRRSATMNTSWTTSSASTAGPPRRRAHRATVETCRS